MTTVKSAFTFVTGELLGYNSTEDNATDVFSGDVLANASDSMSSWFQGRTQRGMPILSKLIRRNEPPAFNGGPFGGTVLRGMWYLLRPFKLACALEGNGAQCGVVSPRRVQLENATGGFKYDGYGHWEVDFDVFAEIVPKRNLTGRQFLQRLVDSIHPHLKLDVSAADARAPPPQAPRSVTSPTAHSLNRFPSFLPSIRMCTIHMPNQ